MKTMKRILCALLVVVMCLTSAPVGGFDLTAEATDYKVGDIIQFGSYPQSEVTDSVIISALNSKAPVWSSWTSYGYYSEGATCVVQGDWMRYTDVTYNGSKYRGVKFTQYRPHWTDEELPSTNTYQDDNGYYTDTVYWFKFEPLEWRILDYDDGLIMCEKVIDTQPFCNVVYYGNDSNMYITLYNDPQCKTYASDYETSSIRGWLNDDFYNLAFTENEKEKITVSHLENKSYYNESEFNSKDTDDKIFLISVLETLNKNYGFASNGSTEDIARVTSGTDYSKCQGLSSSEYYPGKASWLLRTPLDECGFCSVLGNGASSTSMPLNMLEGIRPALRVNLDEIGETPICEHTPVEQKIPATCTMPGTSLYVCSKCGAPTSDLEIIPAAHTPGEWETVVEPTYEAEGKKVKKCTVCGEIVEEEIIPEIELDFVKDEKTGVSIGYPADEYDGKVEIDVVETFTGKVYNLFDTSSALTPKVYDIKLKVNGSETQPTGKVTVKIPLPAGYNPDCTFVYYINIETLEREQLEATYEDGYMVFETDHFSYYGLITVPDTDNCSCNCHAGGIKGFFFKFLLFFQKIFRTNKVCKCGINHY